MPSYEPFEKLTPTTVRLDPVPRADVEAYLEEFGAVSSPLRGNGDLDEMNWKAWRDLRAPDYFIQWNLKQGRFQLTADEYIERWQWSIKSGHV
ncbi:hypothetical protein MMAD_32090 [Mycolicibacterium madagascariense]|uniref:Uncharacterized protein n=1 Tax=Mycolicibacterium madagascariense TaxID=212765 RepID=A0A7I7XIB0_9MYCO|nr:hypothetical protein [Mycolicibacterium madagascariense]MCV7010923.1 hypothetical protein [Mycolicibacterium madagascariense]BBZ28914.1 hypothetical protein MMAD_32090 [Mycolicibacterium madagascariense]